MYYFARFGLRNGRWGKRSCAKRRPSVCSCCVRSHLSLCYFYVITIILNIIILRFCVLCGSTLTYKHTFVNDNPPAPLSGGRARCWQPTKTRKLCSSTVGDRGECTRREMLASERAPDERNGESENPTRDCEQRKRERREADGQRFACARRSPQLDRNACFSHFLYICAELRNLFFLGYIKKRSLIRSQLVFAMHKRVIDYLLSRCAARSRRCDARRPYRPSPSRPICCALESIVGNFNKIASFQREHRCDARFRANRFISSER